MINYLLKMKQKMTNNHTMLKVKETEEQEEQKKCTSTERNDDDEHLLQVYIDKLNT